MSAWRERVASTRDYKLAKALWQVRRPASYVTGREWDEHPHMEDVIAQHMGMIHDLRQYMKEQGDEL